MVEAPICPDCRESVNKGATKCPHCATDLPDKTEAIGQILTGVVLLPVSLVALYLTVNAVGIGLDFLVVMGLFELLIWGGFIGILIAIGVAAPGAIVKGLSERKRYKQMNNPERSEGLSDEEIEQKAEKWAENVNATSEKVSSSLSRLKISPSLPRFRVSSPGWFWPVGVYVGTLLWLSMWVTLDYLALFTVSFFGGMVLLPVAIFFDSRRVRRRLDSSLRWWVYVLLSCIPFAAPLFGGLWLYRRKRLVGSTLG
ncbi:hypothetical protein EXE43_12060 [Halorubrum sp. SS5]|nr:hypothetical protein EXE43_12060 [Halorubrum sp. SS5]